MNASIKLAITPLLVLGVVVGCVMSCSAEPKPFFDVDYVFAQSILDTYPALSGERESFAHMGLLAGALALMLAILAISYLKNSQKTREAEERMQLMFDAMPLTCHLIGRDYEIIDCNQEALNLLGMSCKEEYREKYYDLLPQFQPCGRQSRELRNEYIDKAFDEGCVRYEWQLRKSDGEPQPCEVTLIRVRYRGEYIIAGYARDLREQKAVMEETRRAEIAEESSKAKSSFLATVSHEIRTPMNAILGITEIQLQDEALEPKCKEAFSRIYSSGDLLLSIVNDLLDMSKIDADKLELTPERYETASLINDVVNLNSVRFGGKPLEFELYADENTPQALIGDELRIKQILNNLLSNSFKYTKKGRVKLSVSAEAGNPVTLVFRVSDTGQGMTEEQVDKLFDEYSRFNTEANRMTEGTGLGMHITRSLVRMMGGDIHVESESGIGTTFTVRLPQEDVGAGALGREVTENLRRFREGGTTLKKPQVMREPMPYGSVLVVDDADLNLYVAKGLLAPYELSVDTADSGFEAIDKIRDGREYDIVFMDHMMPEMDGVETVKNMRGMGYSRPIVALTADAVSGRAEMFLKNGFDDFISKPIDIRHMDAILKKLVRDRQPREVVEAARKEKITRKAETRTAGPAFLDAVKKIGAINTEIGLSRVSGMRDIYHDILELFHKKLPGEWEAMSAFMNAPDMKGFSIAVHSMKSQLAAIGAMALSGTAQKLETASKDDAMDYCAAHFPAFKENLIALHTQLSAVFPVKEAPPAPKKPGDHTCLPGHIQKALGAVEDFDGDAAIETINQLRACDYGDEVNTLLNEALAELCDFNFDTGAEILGKIRRFYNE